jgi:hydrophobic/amphiphilic exporter-1 (mainly G- bacteria), HAE1 family
VHEVVLPHFHIREHSVHLLSVFSLRNRALIALVTIVIAVFGGIALSSLKQELIPSLSLPSVYIVSSYPGASPDVVDNDVSGPIESAIQGIAGLDSTSATSQTDASTVTANFVYGTDVTTAEQKVQLAIDRIKATLPDNVDPSVLTFSFSDLPVVQIAVTSDLDPVKLENVLDNTTIPSIKDVAGVSDASLLGATTQRVTITPDQKKLDKLGLTDAAVTAALNANGTLLPSGEITENGKTLTVQAGDKITATSELEDLPLLGATKETTVPSAIPGGAATTTQAPDTKVHTIGSVATVKIENDPVTGISRVNGKPAVTIAVTKTPAGNTVDVSKALNKMIPDLQKAVGGNTKFTVVFDQAPFIQQSINSLAEEGLLGLVFAVIIILVFLLSIRSTLVTAISIPVSVLITFIGMLGAGYTLNIITLGALTIAIGRVVDDSIVVIENIKRHISRGEEKLDAIRIAVREVAGAVTASTLTTVAVFLPIAFTGDVTGELFRPFALTVTIALLASLFVALTIVPVLAYWFLGSKRSKRDIARSGVATSSDPDEDEYEHPTRLQRGYTPILRWTLRFRWLTLGLALLLLLGTAALAPLLKTNFLGSSGQNTLTVTQTLPLGSSLDVRDAAAKKVENVLLNIDGVDTTQLSLGSQGSSLRASFSSSSDATFSLTTDPDVDQEQLQKTIRTALDKVPDAGDIELSASQGSFGSSDIEVDITATSDANLRSATSAILGQVQKLSVVTQATSNLANTQPYIQIKVDRAKAAKKGLSDSQVGNIITAAMNPSATGTVAIDDTTLSIYVDNSKAPQTIAEIKAFTIPTADGDVKLSTLASVADAKGPATITTVKDERSATITATPASDDTGTASAKVQAAVDKVKLPAGTKATLGGVTSQQGDAFGSLGIALLAAILIVYVVMVAAFKSLRQPLLLLLSVPFAATGALALQLISGIPLGVASIIGVLMLIGIVVTNAIVLVDLINQYRRRGLKVGEAVLHGASRRLRPILMTALATIFALLPLGIGITGHGSFISQPLAIIVIGGLVSSTLLTLLVLPTLYYLVEGAKERRQDRRAAREAAAASA